MLENNKEFHDFLIGIIHEYEGDSPYVYGVDNVSNKQITFKYCKKEIPYNFIPSITIFDTDSMEFLSGGFIMTGLNEILNRKILELKFILV